MAELRSSVSFRALSGAVAEIYSCTAGKKGRARRCKRQRSGSVFYRFRPWPELNQGTATRHMCSVPCLKDQFYRQNFTQPNLENLDLLKSILGNSFI